MSGALFTTPCLFFIAGFLQSFSFVQTEDDKLFTFDNIMKYYVKRVLRFEALVGFTLIFAMYIVPMIGGGPIWETYQTKVMQPCYTLWWTNLLFVNNIIPTTGTFDDKCMPFTWFIPALVQVSLLLPIIVFLQRKL